MPIKSKDKWENQTNSLDIKTITFIPNCNKVQKTKQANVQGIVVDVEKFNMLKKKNPRLLTN